MGGMKRAEGSPTSARKQAPARARALALSVVGIALLAACAGDSGQGRESAESVAPEESATAEKLVHPSFSVTEEQMESHLASAAADLRPAFAERFAPRILARPQYFLELLRRSFQQDPDFYRLVDKQLKLPSDYAPTDTVPLNRFRDRLVLNRNDLSVRAVILPDLFAMIEAARQEGITLDVSSTYRSYDYQAGLFERHVANLGREEAERVSAQPGSSQHQLGTTVDFGSITPAFADTAAGRWLAEHAGRFGFSLSYPNGYEALTGYSFEPWHFRYISRIGTQLEAEFFDGLQQHFLEFYHSQAAWFRTRMHSAADPRDGAGTTTSPPPESS